MKALLLFQLQSTAQRQSNARSNRADGDICLPLDHSDVQAPQHAAHPALSVEIV
jgi:hypothetical protein